MRCHHYRCHPGILRQGVASQMERRRVGILCWNHAGSFHVGTDSASFRTDRTLVAGSDWRNGRCLVPECARSGNSPSSSYYGTRPRGASQQCPTQPCDAFRDGDSPAQTARGNGGRSERLLCRRCHGVGCFFRYRPAEYPRGNGDHCSFDDGRRFCCSHLLHLHFHRPARSGRHPVRFRFGFSLFHLPPRDAGFCRWCHALCNER